MNGLAKNKIILIVILISIIIISGCTSQQPPTQPICGNSIVESGEECDNSACPAMQACSDECKCEALAPPQIPE